VNGEWPRTDPNPILDRYTNIHPWASNRVQLQVPEGFNDYINASPVTLTSTSATQKKFSIGVPDKYICMQGPKQETVDHTWHMLWEETGKPDNTTSAVIIMLCPLVCPDPNRPGKMKEQCSLYFPTDETCPPLLVNETDVLGETFKATVKFVSREPTPLGTDIEIRRLSMTVEGEEGEKPVWHFLYPSWPDFGALEEQNVESIVTLMTLSREKNGRAENPRVVHCSAGVGRTGTFVALEFLLGELQGGAWENWDVSGFSGRDAVYDTVNQLRKQRRNMVQAYEQYAFLYEVLKKTWEEMYGASCVGGAHQHTDIRIKLSRADQTPVKDSNACARHDGIGKAIKAADASLARIGESERRQFNACGDDSLKKAVSRNCQ
jgi:protein-tyrosine phosphatase